MMEDSEEVPDGRTVLTASMLSVLRRQYRKAERLCRNPEINIPASEGYGASISKLMQCSQVHRVVRSQSHLLGQFSSGMEKTFIERNRVDSAPNALKVVPEARNRFPRETAVTSGGRERRPQFNVRNGRAGNALGVGSRSLHEAAALLLHKQLKKGTGVRIQDQRRCSRT
jgi:hypothetical protein